jgi:hypothetical protein
MFSGCRKKLQTHSGPNREWDGATFFRGPAKPAQCALEISVALKDQPHIRLRMAVHSGPLNQVTDVNDMTNIAGAGINIAQRVMDLAMPATCFCRNIWREDLAEYDTGGPYLRDTKPALDAMSVSRHDLIVCAGGKHPYPARDTGDAAIFRGELEVKWKELLETAEAEKRSDDPITSMNKQCAISS